MRLTRPLRSALLRVAVLLAAGLAYGLFAARFGGVPCPFRLVTGLKCPGCGITTLLLAVGRGNLAAAFAANPFLFCTWPLPAALVVWQGWCRAAGRPFGRRAERLTLLYAAALVVWGGVRNFVI
ncbi:DUF2752 domain-containing protein [uncultured Gemmiger sp.]|uniref:DUF2752 domain-containing protein n=1 Tax=uncultured Gemmiger sp. TaxID=1623490 RepID=UPI0025F7554C|nr:DUF2752 domain-containing protein [uncultured Gemmiger sp.]